LKYQEKAARASPKNSFIHNFSIYTFGKIWSPCVSIVHPNRRRCQMSDESLDADFLAQYEKESDWARKRGISQRTAARYREEQGLPSLSFGGCIWIPKREAIDWIAARLKRRNPPPRRRRQSPANTEQLTP